jgi:hypothetical protein
MQGGGNGTRNQHGKRAKTWALLDPSQKEEERGRAGLDGEVAASYGLAMCGLGGRLGMTSLGSHLGACAEAAWEHVTRRTDSVSWPAGGRQWAEGSQRQQLEMVAELWENEGWWIWDGQRL